MRVSGGHLCAQHRSTDRGGSRDLEPAALSLLRYPKFCCALERRQNFDRCALSAQTPLIVFLAEKLIAPLCFLLPQKPIGLFGDPEKFFFIVHRRRSGSMPKADLLCSQNKKTATFQLLSVLWHITHKLIPLTHI